MLINRFQIEDLILQDESGVVFQAVDTETGNAVALRRFFPFGAKGGGLEPDERTAYNIALARLAELRHPALRAVVSGGCDPVDGIPFIATEWVDGGRIGPLLRNEPLPPQVAAELLTQALEVCELLSQVMAEEAVWVETDPDAIILGSEASGRGFTFWISPLKWLNGGKQPRGLESIITLTEQLMGWQGRVVGDHAGNGLGAWLNWLRGNAGRTSLREARENLAAALGDEPPANARQLLRAARQPPPEIRKSSKVLILGMIGLALVLVGAGGWLWTWQRDRQLRQSEVVEKLMVEMEKQSRSDGKSRTDAINERAARLSAEAEGAWQDGVFTADQGELLARHEGSVVSLEGVVQRIGTSDKGHTLYLLFSENPGRDDPRGAVSVATAGEGLNRESLDAFVGSKVRVTGRLRINRSFGMQRLEIPITERNAIQRID